MKKLLLFLVLSVALAMQPLARATHGNNAGAHWNRNTVKVLDSVTPDWDAALRAGSDAWNSGLSNVKTKVAQDRAGRKLRKRCPFKKGVVRVCNYRYGAGKGWAGITEYSYSLSTGHLLRARIKLNDSTTSASHRDAVAAHEIGHALGLGHRSPSETTSCMTPTVTAAQKSPDAHDWGTVDRLHHGHHSSTAADDTYEGASTSPSRDDPQVRFERHGDRMDVTWIDPAR